MRNPDAKSTALAGAESPLLLETPAQVERAGRHWRASDVLGLDTEFVRERTYHARLGLVQISDGKKVWLLDPLVEGTLEPLGVLLAASGVRKIFHGPSEDLEVLAHVTGEVPDPLIDTQLACAMLGRPLQLGYHDACQWLLDVEVDRELKELTRSDWCARPLSADLLRYAALDVCLLPLMWAHLEERLRSGGRLEWLAEDCARMVESARHPAGPASAWERIRGHGRLDGVSLGILKALAAWREKEARKRDRPRGFIVRDPVLLAIARGKLRRESDLEALADLHPRARKRYAPTIVSIVDEALSSGKRIEPEPALRPAERKLLRTMRGVTADVAAELGVEPALLATRREMQQLLLADDRADVPERLRGWRKPVITDRLLELK